MLKSRYVTKNLEIIANKDFDVFCLLNPIIPIMIKKNDVFTIINFDKEDHILEVEHQGQKHFFDWPAIKYQFDFKNPIVIEEKDKNTVSKNEDFILVNLQSPNLFISKGKSIYQNGFYFSKSLSDRKSFKTKQSVLKFIREQVQSDPVPHLDQYDIRRYHLHYNNPYMKEYNFDTPLESFKNLELRKYNLDTKKISSEPCDFDVFSYALHMKIGQQIVSQYGEGVASILSKIIQEEKTEEYPFIFSAKYSKRAFSNFVLKQENIPLEKDIALDVCFKILNIKKNQFMHYNQNSFVAIACDSEETFEKFKQNFKNPEKEVTLLKTKDFINDKKISHILSSIADPAPTVKTIKP